MWIRHLELTNYRNYRNQELSLDRGPSVLLGDNAQGKSNLLEAIFLLAAARSERAQTDAELICWDALDDVQPVARVAAQVERADGPLELEVIIVGRRREKDGRLMASKRLRVNGLPRRQQDLVGQLTAVLFTTDDLDLVTGAPAHRRRFIDVTLSQLDGAYRQALQRYTKVITQRNALLKRIQEGVASPDELVYWDEELARDGALLTHQRADAIDALARHVRETHRHLSGGAEEMEVAYAPRLEKWDGARAATEPDAIADALRDALVANQRREIGAGLTLTGPHRDDLSFTLNGVAAASFASRGQQRTASLALRLAEARFMAERRGDVPVVLLDDVLSELDEARRHAVLESLEEWDQLLITSADIDRFGEGLPASAAVFRVRAGQIETIGTS
ncbi:MAG: DNA replication/repair protein RecF [Dehalococcoidia bacterium]